MLNINMRKVMFSIVWATIVSFVMSLVLIFLAVTNIFSITLFNNVLGFQIVYAFIVNALGVLIGLMWEKRTRARYFAKMESNPALSERAKKIYKKALIWGAVFAVVFYILPNIWAIWIFFALHLNTAITVPPATHTGWYISLVRNIILALVFLWLYFQPAPEETSPTLNIKKGVLWFAIFSIIMAIFNISSLVASKVAPGTTSIQLSGPGFEKPLKTLIEGQDQEVSLGEIYASLGQFSVVLPSGFRMVASGEDVVIEPDTATLGIATPYYMSVTPSTQKPQDFVNNLKSDFEENTFAYRNVAITPTVFLGYPAEEISCNFPDGGYEINISFESNNNPVVVSISKASVSSNDPSLVTLNSNLDAIWKSLKFGTNTNENSSALPSASSSSSDQQNTSTTSSKNSTTSSSYVFPIKELGIEITVPNDLKLTTYAQQPAEDGVGFSSVSLKNLVTQLDPNEKYCGDADANPIGSIAPIKSDKLANCMDPKLINGTYFCGTFGIGNALPDDYCAGNQQVHNLIRQQTEELGTAFDNSARAY